jgi:ABC-2 type transport system permease protein
VTRIGAVLLIAARDFRERVASRAFQLSTGLTILLVVGFILVPSFLGTGDGRKWTIGTVGDTPADLAAAVGAAAGSGTTVTTKPFASQPAARAALDDGTIDLAVDASGVIVIDGGTDSELTSLVVASLAALNLEKTAAAEGAATSDLTALLTGGYTIETVTATGTSTTADRSFAFFATIILFMSIITYGSWILIGVIEEKTNRVVEVVLGTVRPHQLLAGKVLGIGVLGVAQIVVIGIVAIVTLSLQSAFAIPDAAGTVLAWAFVWYLLGFAFYAVAYAAAGSLVSRQEEAQNAAFPLTLLLMAAYFVASFSITGENPVLRVSSLLPMFAPMTMPLRIAGGDATGVEITLSIALMVATTYVLIRLAGRIYARGLLQSGRRLRWREAWRIPGR